MLNSLKRKRSDHDDEDRQIKKPKLLQEFNKISKTELKAIYLKIKELLVREYNKSKQLNKPLLILFGESHRLLSSAFLEAIVSYIAYTDLNIKDLMLECDILRYYHWKWTDFQFQFMNPRVFLWTEVEGIAKEANTKIHLIDNATTMYNIVDSIKGSLWDLYMKQLRPILPEYLASFLPKINHDAMVFMHSKEGISKRNDVMASNIKSNLKNNLCIVGAYHLQGLIEETDLSLHFHIVALNGSSVNIPVFSDCSQEFKDKAKEYVSFSINKDKVYQLNELLGNIYEDDLETALTLLKQIHLESQLSTPQPLSMEVTLKLEPSVSSSLASTLTFSLGASSMVVNQEIPSPPSILKQPLTYQQDISKLTL